MTILQEREHVQTQYSYGLLSYDEMSRRLYELNAELDELNEELEDSECPEHGGACQFINKKSGGVFACDCGAESDGW